MTKPFLSLSNGIEARKRSVAVDNAVKAAKPAIPISLIDDSAPPVIITSAYPFLIWWNALPMALLALAQAVTIA